MWEKNQENITSVVILNQEVLVDTMHSFFYIDLKEQLHDLIYFLI